MINMVCEVSEGVKLSQMELDSGYLRIDENDAKRMFLHKKCGFFSCFNSMAWTKWLVI